MAHSTDSTVPLPTEPENSQSKHLRMVAATRMGDASRLKETSKLVAPCRTCALRVDCLIKQWMTAITGRPGSKLFHSRVLRRGEHVFYEGDQLNALNIVKSGSVKTYKTVEMGDEHVVTFHMPGDVLGVDALGTEVHVSSAVALEAASVCWIPFAELKYLSEYSPCWFYSLVAGELECDHHLFLMLTKKDAESRLAGFLIDQSERFKARGYSAREFNLSMARHDIGNHLGLAVETVSRLFTRMQQDGLLEVNRRRVTIRDLDGLRAMAGIQQAY